MTRNQIALRAVFIALGLGWLAGFSIFAFVGHFHEAWLPIGLKILLVFVLVAPLSSWFVELYSKDKFGVLQWTGSIVIPLLLAPFSIGLLKGLNII